MAEIPDRITARGERSSWEAAAINSVCSCLLFSRGVIILPVKNQEQILRARIARKAAPENASLCNRILCFTESREYRMIILTVPWLLGIRAVET